MKFYRIRNKVTGLWSTRSNPNWTDSEAYAATFDSIKNLRLHLFSIARQLKWNNGFYKNSFSKFYADAEIVECEVNFVTSDQSHLNIIKDKL